MSSRSRAPLARVRPFTLGLLAALVVATAASGAAEVRDRAVVAGAGSSEARAHALERLVNADGGTSVLRRALEGEENAVVRETALGLAPGRLDRAEVAALLAARLGRARGTEPATLVDLHAAAAQGDERALGSVARLVGERRAPARVRLAAATALGAIATRRGLALDRLPPVSLDASGVGELAESLDEDAAPWRIGVVRALSRRLALDPRALERLRARARATLAPEPGACVADGALDLLLVRGDHPTLAALPLEASDRAGLLAPLGCLVATPDPDELDRTLALEAWGGRGAWRRLEALASRASGRAALREALERAADPRRPAAVAASVLLSRAGDASAARCLGEVAAREDALGVWARAALGEPALEDPGALESLGASGLLEELPPPLVLDAVHRGGERAAAALARALGRAPGAGDGELAFVLEPGAGDGARVFLTDLAIEAFSTSGSRER